MRFAKDTQIMKSKEGKIRGEEILRTTLKSRNGMNILQGSLIQSMQR